MFILKTGHQPGVYVPLRALFLVNPGEPGLAVQTQLVRPSQCSGTGVVNLLGNWS